MSDIFPAATVVLVRDGREGLETLLLRRNRAVEFGGGSWVFPGGRIDQCDYNDDQEDIEMAARWAAVRETREEAAIEIEEANLHYFAHWTTPPEAPKRFATWFFICPVDSNLDVVVDGSEIVEHRWYKPNDAIVALNNKEIEMMPPTFVTLTEIAQARAAKDALSMYRQRTIPQYLPRFSMTERGICMLYPGDAGYEDRDHGAEGSRHRMWMLEEGWRFENDQ
jgi:8-oxo-dGTP pyrophosphatase MutT (NUDIX family)